MNRIKCIFKYAYILLLPSASGFIRPLALIIVTACVQVVHHCNIMFSKEGSSTIGGKKDSPLKKSDRRKLRDRTLEILFTGDALSNNESADENASAKWTVRAENLVNDAIIASKGGEVLRAS